MGIKKSCLYFIIALLLSLNSPVNIFAIEVDGGDDCYYLFESYLGGNKQQSSYFFRECESCCEVLGNDSLLIELYLRDTSHLYIDSILLSSLLQAKECKSCDYSELLGNAYSKAGFIHAHTLPDTAIAELKKAHLYYSKAKNLKKQAIALQNIAFIFDEKKNQNEFALQYSFGALKKMELLKDTLGVANLLKYIGFLYGKMKSPTIGIAYVSKAIELFQAQKFNKGVAVSYFDLAMIYKENKNVKMEEQYLKKAKKIWLPYHDFRRIFIINNALLESYIRFDNKGKFNKIAEENKRLLVKDSHHTIHDKDEIIFHNLINIPSKK